MALWMIYILLLVLLGVIGYQKVLRRKPNSSVCTGWHVRALAIVSYVNLLFAISLSVATNTSCRFLYTSDDYLDENLEAMGLWKVLRNNGEGSDECYPYSLFLAPVEGPALTASRTFGVMASLFGGAAVIYYLLASTFGYPQKFIPIFLVFIAIIQALTHVLLRSYICDEITCSLAEGSLASLTSTAYWLLGGWCIYDMQKCSVDDLTKNTVSDQEPRGAEP